MTGPEAEIDDGVIRTHARQTTRTARYAVVGAEPERASQIWFVLHGYGQLAARFLRPFVAVVPHDCCIVAPEALSRFYLELPRADGSHMQRIGASWLTREAREQEIADALHWLAQVHDEVVDRATRGTGAAPTVNVLGFSQGVATAMRWLAYGGVSPAQLVIWAGGLAHDVDAERLRAVLARTRVTMVAGMSDHFATAEAQARVRDEFARIAVPTQEIAFEGGHHLDARVLGALLGRESDAVRMLAMHADVVSRAVLLHGGASSWRRRLRERVLERVTVEGADPSAVVVLLSSRDAEAAKWLVDPRLELVVSAEDAHVRASVAALAPAVDVLWVPAMAAAGAEDATMEALADAIAQRLRRSGAVGG